ncbi:predicted protein [Fibroporia radiculosa]|uniref:Uncharacterized protein n=1 Tax=Fibroporia radiculosa TaxID=599839 RepID=J7S6P0_9APHY|nr:predicted protein [Fibroporia radiculosa]
MLSLIERLAQRIVGTPNT